MRPANGYSMSSMFTGIQRHRMTPVNRILDNISTNAMYNARMQAPRTLWDTG